MVAFYFEATVLIEINPERPAVVRPVYTKCMIAIDLRAKHSINERLEVIITSDTGIQCLKEGVGFDMHTNTKRSVDEWCSSFGCLLQNTSVKVEI